MHGNSQLSLESPDGIRSLLETETGYFKRKTETSLLGSPSTTNAIVTNDLFSSASAISDIYMGHIVNRLL